MAAASGAAAEAAAGPEREPEEDLPALDPAEVRRRLEHSERQFRNRRKVLIRGLPADVSNQDVHELLKDFELKYCFVDKYKGTAFITLLDSSQASSAISQLHGSQLRGCSLRVQLQASDCVLCVANLPRLLSQQRFEELLRPFGSLERCFLVYSPSSGHSKGYGFVEFMRKDSAARARRELQGRPLGRRELLVHWGGSAPGPEQLHSRCLCIDRLPQGFSDLQQLRGLFGTAQAPSFCQLAQGPGGSPAGFAVAEFCSPEDAERALAAADGAALGGSRVRASFCAPGPGGAAALAAIIAARGAALPRGRGLLPEPPLLQLLCSPNLRLLLQPLLGRQAGILGAAPPLPLVPGPGVPPALLQLRGLNSHAQKPGILGDSPLSSLIPPKAPGKLLGEIPADLAPKSALGPPQGPPKNNLGEGGAPALSLLGEPPKKLQLPLSPFLSLNLNLNLNLPPGPAQRKGFRAKPGVLGPPRIPPSDPLEFPQDLGSRIFPQPNLGSFRHQGSPSCPGLDRGGLAPPAPPLFSGSPSSCFSSGLRAGLRQSQLSKTISIPPSTDSILPLAPPNPHLKTPLGRHKRGFSHLLPSPEPSPEGCYVGQHSQGLGGHYADSYLKRKRIF